MKRRSFLALLCAGVPRLGVAEAVNATGYRVDATILLLSIPIFTRANVGEGYARHAVEPGPAGATHTLEFAAGSLPERARGLNRLGMIRETVIEERGAIHDAHYVGFMTASKEESLAEAKKALNTKPQQSQFVAIEGSSRPEEVHSVRAHFISAGSPDRNAWKRLLSEAAAAFGDPSHHTGETRFHPESGAMPTFLFAVAQAIRSQETKMRQVCVYSRDHFELTTTRKPDAETGRKLANKGLGVQPSRVFLLSGMIRNLRTGDKTPFRIWTEDGGHAVPVRIEYQPRGFLQLSLEAVPHTAASFAAGLG